MNVVDKNKCCLGSSVADLFVSPTTLFLLYPVYNDRIIFPGLHERAQITPVQSGEDNCAYHPRWLFVSTLIIFDPVYSSRQHSWYLLGQFVFVGTVCICWDTFYLLGRFVCICWDRLYLLGQFVFVGTRSQVVFVGTVGVCWDIFRVFVGTVCICWDKIVDFTGFVGTRLWNCWDRKSWRCIFIRNFVSAEYLLGQFVFVGTFCICWDKKLRFCKCN